MKTRASLVTLVLAFLATVAAGQVATQSTEMATNVARGFAPEKAFQLGDLDNVNLFNGNLILRVPLGPSLPMGPNLSFQWVLTYNAHPWDYLEVSGEADVVPARGMNAGLGWKLTLGEVLAPTDPDNPTFNQWVYLAPDGSQHVFYASLHEGEEVVSNVYYTRDSTYLRLQDVSGGAATAARVEFPDGSWRLFQTVTTDNPPVGLQKLRLTTVRDPFGNGYNVSYVGPANPSGQRYWQVTQQGNAARATKVFFDETAGVAGLYYKDRGGVVARIEMPSTSGTAVWSFSYQTKDIYTACGAVANEENSEDVPLLWKIEQPGGSTFEMGKVGVQPNDPPDVSWGYSFTEVSVPPPPSGQRCSKFAGLLTRFRLPTKGFFEYAWDTYSFPSAGGEQCKEYFHFPAGVTARRLKKRSGGLYGTWTYQQTMLGDNPGCGNSLTRPLSSRTRVGTPLGHWTENFFNLDQVGTEYGLPLSHEGWLGGSSQWGISTTTYDPSFSSSTPIRSTYLRYENDGVLTDESNQRVAAERTIYHDDSNAESTVTYASFDGFGHYRRATTGGNWSSGGNTRATDTRFNPTYGDFPPPGCSPSSCGSAATAWPTSSAWMLQVFSESSICEGSTLPSCSGGQLAKEQACVNAATGFVERRRILAGASPGANDLVRVFGQTTGYLDLERDYGGDVQAVSTGSNLCALSLPGSEQYRLRHTYSSGVLASSEYMLSNTTPMPFKVVDRDIHAATGLVVSERDTAGIQTSYSFDQLGRLTFVKPADGLSAWTQYQYSEATFDPNSLVGTLANLATLRRANGSTTGSTYLTEASITFDDLGRVYREFVRQPDASNSRRETLYNAGGLKDSVGEWNTSGVAAGKTSYTNYDAFGRPRAITPPDGAAHVVQLGYAGGRVVARTVRIGTARNASGQIVESTATTTETYDRQGRLASVQEPSGTGGAQITTAYGYDEGNRLVNVTTSSQFRSFSYDGRGLLLSETHPEKGLSGDGTVFYGQYDARGHALRKDDGDIHLAFTYDRAERLLTVVDPTPSPDTPLKQFTYDSGGGQHGEGKLVTATRHNYLPIPWLAGRPIFDLVVSETYTYDDPSGSVSSRQTDFGVGYSFRQAWTYDALGNAASLTYPRCLHATCTQSTPGANRTVAMSYTQGRLTSVTEAAPTPQNYGTLSYHPNGLLYQAEHGNGVVDTQANDPNQMRRPFSISTSATPVVFGPYAYDGAGNITDIGGNQMLYDKVSRLVSFKFTSPQSQTFSYDVYGNLTSIATTVSGSTTTQSLPILGKTNRLSGAQYDKAGNVTGWNSLAYGYDLFNQLGTLVGQGNDESYAYTADDERIYSLHYDANQGIAGNVETIRLRNLDNKVLTEYVYNGGNAVGHWFWKKDYIYRDGLLLAALQPGINPNVTVSRHFTLDHLGTPRLVTNETGAGVSDHHYYPYGQELVPQTSEALKFTGHERDFNTTPGTTDDLDYMHARYCSPVLGRFLGVDPKARRSPASHPQLWNRYTLDRGNPLKFVDPDGLEGVHYQNADDQKFYEKAAARNWKVKAVLDAFGPGSGRDLTVQRGDPGRHPNGFPLAAVTAATLKQTLPPQEDIIAAFSAGGEAAASRLMDSAPHELKEATITLSGQADDKDKLHEFGHIDQALRDPEGYLRDEEEASAATTVDDYKKTNSEKYADQFARDSAKKQPSPP